MVLLAGCGDLRRNNASADIPAPRQPPDESLAEVFLKTHYLYPVRDWLSLSWLGRALFGDEAWDVMADGGVPDSGLYTNRDPAACDIDAAWGLPPQPPWSVASMKSSGATDGFIGRDASGRTWFVKFDRPDWPELGSASEVIAARVYWSLGYHVSPTFVVTVTGTGDSRIDGRRGAASLKVNGDLLGPMRMDRYRLRREVRALRVAAAWLNDTDRGDRNTLVALERDRAMFYLIDFNAALGSWNGRPKDPWRGRRHAWDVEWQVLGVLSLGLLRPDVDESEPVVSAAVGRFSARFEPRAWRSQDPSTAFDRLTGADAAGLLANIGRISDDQLRSIVAAGCYSRPADAEYVLRTLIERRERLAAFAGRPSGGAPMNR